MTKNHLDLTAINPNSIASVLQANLDSICSSTSANEVYNKVSTLLVEHKINTTASNRLLLNLQRSNSFQNSIYIISNSFLAGCGLAVTN